MLAMVHIAQLVCKHGGIANFKRRYVEMMMPIDPVICPGFMHQIMQFRYKSTIERTVPIFFWIVMERGHMVCYHNTFRSAFFLKGVF